MVEREFGLRRGQELGLGRIDDRRLAVESNIQAVRRGDATLHDVHHFRKLTGRVAHAQEKGEKRHQSAQAERFIHDVDAE